MFGKKKKQNVLNNDLTKYTLMEIKEFLPENRNKKVLSEKQKRELVSLKKELDIYKMMIDTLRGK